MNNPVITKVTREVPPDSPGTEFDEVEIKRRARIYASEMREVTAQMFGEPYLQGEIHNG